MKLKDYIKPEKKVASLFQESKVSDAALMMKEHECGNVIVTDTEGEIRGILTDRDIVIRCISQGDDCEKTPVSEVMTLDPQVMNHEETGTEALARMRSFGISRIIVVDDDIKPVGVVTADHLLKFVAAELDTLASLSEQMHRNERAVEAA